jgi:DNA-binding CsgD family transcriptional regulator
VVRLQRALGTRKGFVMDDKGFERLTPRELQVLRLAAQGLKPKVIGREIDLSERTVYTHLLNATRKLGATGIGEAAMAMARREALGPHAKSTEQFPPIARPPHVLLDLLFPETSGRRFNDLDLGHRLLVIVLRAALIAFILFAVASLVRNIGQLFAHAA